MNARPTAFFSRDASSLINNGEALPWSLIGAALAAMAAAYFSGGRFIGLPILAVATVLSRFTAWRLPSNFLISYGLRAVILVAALTLMNQTDVQDSTVWYLKQEDTNIAAYALATDIALRACEKRQPAAAREGLGVVVLMTAFLFAAATNTYDRLPIQLITPIYVIGLLLCFRDFAQMQQPASTQLTRRPGLVLLRAIVLLLTLGFAGASVYAVTRYEYQVTNWAMQFVRQHHNDHHDIGFAASPRLATVFNPEPSITRVLLVDGKITEPHWRVAAFDTYQDAQWSPRVSDRVYSPIAAGRSTSPGGAHALTAARLDDTTDLIPTPLSTSMFRSEDPLEQDSSGTVRDTRSGSFESYGLLDPTSPTFQGPLAIEPDAKSRLRLLAIDPKIDPRVIKLARKVAGVGDAAMQISRLADYLRHHHAYSLSFEPQGEPLSDFILNDRAAHCQYFASAMAIMARAIGVPARFVGGFYAHEPYGNGQTVVRQRDAHAWAECWLNGVGWLTVDPTPTGGRPDALFADPPAWRRWWEKVTDLPGQVRELFSEHALMLEKLAAAGVLVALGVWFVRWACRGRKRVHVSTPQFPGPNANLIELARRYEQWMTRRGMPCPPESTWRSHLKMKWPSTEPLELCERFVHTYDRARFGIDEGESPMKARELLDQIESESEKIGLPRQAATTEEERYGSAHR